MAGLTVIPSEGTVLQYEDAGSWKDVPGVSSWTESGGEAPERDIVAFEGVAARTGRQRVPSIECEVSAYIPHHPAWIHIRNLAVTNALGRFRLTTKKELVFTNADVSATEAGGVLTVVLKSGSAEVLPDLTQDIYSPGMIIEVADDAGYLVITGPAGSTTTIPIARGPNAPSAITANKAITISVPSLRRGPFNASVQAADRAAMAAEGDLTSGLTLKPAVALPQWAVVV